MRPIYILGCGAIGYPLAAHLADAGRPVVAVRTSRHDLPKSTITVTVQNGPTRLAVPTETVSLASLARLDGTIVIATKSYTNEAIAEELRARAATGPIVIMQNGVGVEKPFLDAPFSSIYRCVLYVTSQATSEGDFAFSPIAASPIGTIRGDEPDLERCVEDLTTAGFPFRSEANIPREIWKKAIINSVFNSICPLLEVDNGVFVRNGEAARLAREVVAEGVTLVDRLNVGLSESELIEQIMRISRGSNQLISTLQDIRNGRQTEIDFLNLEMVRLAASLQPSIALPKVELLGRMVAAKSLLHLQEARA